MIDSWQFFLVFSAVAIGWLLGRIGRLGPNADSGPQHRQYYNGLNYLVNDQPDSTLDSCVTSLAVNSAKADKPIAVGNLMRPKG